MNARGSWLRSLAAMAFRGLVVLVALACFGIVWRPLVVAAVALVVAAVAAVVVVVVGRLLLFRWRGW